MDNLIKIGSIITFTNYLEKPNKIVAVSIFFFDFGKEKLKKFLHEQK